MNSGPFAATKEAARSAGGSNEGSRHYQLHCYSITSSYTVVLQGHQSQGGPTEEQAGGLPL